MASTTLNVRFPVYRPNPNPRRLTATETWVMELVVNEAMSNADIATELGVSIETIKCHMTRIMNKTGYGSRMELAVRTLQKRHSSEESGPVEVEFFKAMQHHLKGLTHAQCRWLLDAIEVWAVKLRAGKVQPVRVEMLQ
jgi:DNA-binding CsgD family transcriptional regulator